MIPSHFTLLFRRMIRSKLVSIIQILSLVLANVAGILVLLYALDEYSYDRFQVNRERIYKVVSDIKDATTGETQSNLETNSWPVGYVLKNDYPEVESVLYGRNGAFLQVNQGDEKIQENVLYMSEEFLTMFSFPVIAGNPETALTEPYSIVLSTELADKYFKDIDPLGKTLLMNDSLNMKITGVVEVPKNSHIQFGMLVSFTTFEEMSPNFSYTSDNGWGNFNVWNYVMLKEGVDHAAFHSKAKGLFMDKAGEMAGRMGLTIDIGFEPLRSYYLESKYGNGLGPQGNIERVRLIMGIGLLIILLASINFINLSTARSVFRAKEVGLRKVVGSTRGRLIRQFMTESFLLTGLSFLVSLLIAQTVLPLYNLVLDKSYTLQSLTDLPVFLSVVGTVLLIGIISGYYPALVMSRFKPSEILKGKLHTGQSGVRLRRALVVFQFFICSGLIIGVLISQGQIHFMKERPLGFDKEQLVTLDLRSIPNSKVQRTYEVVLNDLEKLPYLENISFTAALPGRTGWNGQWCSVEGMEEGENLTVHLLPIDENFVPTFKMELVAGRNFREESASDLDNGLIINERIVDILGLESPEEAIGKKVDSPSGFPKGEIIGVVKNFNQRGLQEEISPIVMDHYTQVSKYIVLKYNQSNASKVVEDIKMIWEEHYAETEFNYFFVDENFDAQYKAEERIMKIFTFFTMIGIFIAIIGLIGLISFVVTAKRKELGIRRVLGAESWRLTLNMLGEFLLLVVIANVLAAPLAWIYGTKWLESFAYHMSFSALFIIITLGATALIALMTIAIQSIQAGRVNPAETLRSE